MSKEEVERFVADIKTQPDLIDELKGTSGGIDSIVDFANAKGYKISADEARTYIQDKVGRDLTDEQLDAIAGGKGSVYQNTEAATATTEAAGAETTVVAAAEVFNLAVAVVVLT